MSKVIKVLVGLCLIFVIIVAVGFFLVSRYLTEDRIKAMIIPPLEETTGLKVDIGAIKRSGLAGVKITNVSFVDPKENEEVLSTKEIKLSLQLMPLLHGKLSVAELIFVEPKVTIVREKDGRLNLERYLKKEKKAPKEEEKKAPPKFALVFQNLRLKNAQINFIDAENKLPPVQLLLSLASHFSLTGGKLSLQGEGTLDSLVSGRPLLSDLNFKVQAVGEEIKVSFLDGELLKGKLSGQSLIKGEKIQGKIKLSALDLKEAASWLDVLKPYFFPDLETKIPPVAGNLNLETDFALAKGNLTALKALGDLNLTLAEHPIFSGLKFQASGARDIKLAILGGKFLEGQVNGDFLFKHNQTLRGKLNLKNGDFASAREITIALAPYFLEEKPEIPPLNGSFDLQASVRGSMANPLLNVVFLPHPLQVSIPDYQISLNGQVTLKRLLLLPKVALEVNGQKMNLAGTVNLKPSIPVANLLISGQHLDVKALLPKEGQTAEKGKAQGKKGKGGQAEKKNQLAVPLKGTIKLQFGQVCYKLCAEKVHSEINLTGERINLKNLSFLLAGAVNQINGQISDLSRQPQGKLSYSIAGLDLPTILSAFAPKSNLFTSGKITTQGSFSWQGLESDLIKKTLNGGGIANFVHVGLKEFKVMSVLASALRLDELKKTVFRSGEGSYSIQQGKMNLRGKFQTQGIRLSLEGIAGLDGSLDLKSEIFLSGRMAQLFAQRFPGASLFKVEKGYAIPLTIKGTLDAPKVSLIKVEQKIKEKAVEKLFQFLAPKEKKKK